MMRASVSVPDKLGELARRQPRIAIGAFGLTGILIVEFAALLVARHPFT